MLFYSKFSAILCCDNLVVTKEESLHLWKETHLNDPCISTKSWFVSSMSWFTSLLLYVSIYDSKEIFSRHKFWEIEQCIEGVFTSFNLWPPFLPRIDIVSRRIFGLCLLALVNYVHTHIYAGGCPFSDFKLIWFHLLRNLTIIVKR